MLDLSNLETPVFPHGPNIITQEQKDNGVEGMTQEEAKATGLQFVVKAMDAWVKELENYQGKADKAGAKVSAILEAVINEDESAVKIADKVLENVRQMLLHAIGENPNVAVVLFPQLEEIKKAVGSYRSEATVVVQGNSDEDRDIIAEYEALDDARTMIEGTFNAWQLSVDDLPSRYVDERRKNSGDKDSKGNIIWEKTGEKVIKFPGKLTNPNGEGKTSPGKTPVSFNFAWTLETEDETIELGKSLPITRLARITSNEYDLLSFDDLHTRLKNKGWSATSETIEVDVPRGVLKGTKVKSK